MKTASFNPGDLIRLGNPTGSDSDGAAFEAFTTIDGTIADPTAVALTVTTPSGAVRTYGWPSAGVDGVLTREGPGRFYFDVELNASGKWSWQLSGTGTVDTTEDGILWVLRSAH